MSREFKEDDKILIEATIVEIDRRGYPNNRYGICLESEESEYNFWLGGGFAEIMRLSVERKERIQKEPVSMPTAVGAMKRTQKALTDRVAESIIERASKGKDFVIIEYFTNSSLMPGGLAKEILITLEEKHGFKVKYPPSTSNSGVIISWDVKDDN